MRRKCSLPGGKARPRERFGGRVLDRGEKEMETKVFGEIIHRRRGFLSSAESASFPGGEPGKKKPKLKKSAKMGGKKKEKRDLERKRMV